MGHRVRLRSPVKFSMVYLAQDCQAVGTHSAASLVAAAILDLGPRGRLHHRVAAIAQKMLKQATMGKQ